jgi:hypothetical protein
MREVPIIFSKVLFSYFNIVSLFSLFLKSAL